MNIEEIREVFEKDRFAVENGIVIDEVGENYAKCSVVLTERHKNAMGGIMGGVHFTLADFTFAVASNSGSMGTVALNTDISFLNPVKGKKLTAEANLVKDGHSTCCYNVRVTDDLGNIVAEVKTIGFHCVKK